MKDTEKWLQVLQKTNKQPNKQTKQKTRTLILSDYSKGEKKRKNLKISRQTCLYKISLYRVSTVNERYRKIITVQVLQKQTNKQTKPRTLIISDYSKGVKKEEKEPENFKANLFI